ncbi:hypothetical protein BKP45_08265 [Anaerobacillus alkalidiazotrophicus]|uniref:Peptidoglycan binding domain-containing protein n=1 Tax=Anaerobacillus alkalidiazotrophicus TaxID=472963 RepID=A0A1S2M7L1_9BACI|nr:VanW family protein [Anaerobacillus alkalidiazotrophicus]OIJ20782.1 hypothetical protein BKP45_08265 [Anaerobacillus alkalidiazotrophicus]
MRFSLLLVFFVLAQLTNVNEASLTLTLNGETIGNVSKSDFFSNLGEPVIDIGKSNDFIEKLDKQIYYHPINAYINKEGKIIPEQLGYKLDQEKFIQLFFNYLLGNSPSQIEIPTIPLYPKVDSELLANIRVKPIGHFVTYFNKRNKSRAHNINLAVEAINNHVVFPGEVFSFNEVVGKRTYEKGYLPGPVIIRGRVFLDFGGGICQVSSTLFNAVDRAGVEIVERYSHSKRVPYVPPGRDATVSWYGPDFSFKNIHNQPILICAHIYGNMVSINIYSSEVINYK